MVNTSMLAASCKENHDGLRRALLAVFLFCNAGNVVVPRPNVALCQSKNTPQCSSTDDPPSRLSQAPPKSSRWRDATRPTSTARL
jgi:hypothetical protein